MTVAKAAAHPPALTSTRAARPYSCRAGSRSNAERAAVTLPGYGARHGTFVSHRRLAGNTAVPFYYGFDEQLSKTIDFLRSGNFLNVDIFALKDVAGGPMITPLGSTPVSLKPDETVEASVVIQNKAIGHSLIPEVRDLYEAWVSVTVEDAAGTLIYRSGFLKPDGMLDSGAHSFTNRPVDLTGSFVDNHKVWTIHSVANDNTIQSGRSTLVRYQFHISPGVKSPIAITAAVECRLRQSYLNNVLGLEHTTGWGQACCVGDYNNDGHDDLFVTYYGQNVLYRNNGTGTFTDVTQEARLIQPGPKIRWNSGCTFVDYNRDGNLDLFVANYVDFDLKTAPKPEDGPCTYKGILVACGPPGLPGGRNILYHNNGDGTFSDVSEKARMWTAVGTYGLSVAASDFDNDGWPDIYVANDSAPATLYLNQKDGTFRDIAIEAGAALSAEAKPQAGMGVSIGDYNRDGNMDVVKTNFAGDTDSLYTNLGDATFEDRTYPGGLGVNTRLLGWGVGFFDMDNDGWLDILMSNGHVYPEVDRSKGDLKYAEHKYLYRNLRNGRFEEVTSHGGPGILEDAPARGCAFGDYNNDGVMDVAVNCINATPQLLRCDSTLNRNWIKIKLVGVKSNRSGIGSRVLVTAMTTLDAAKPLLQTEELRSGGSYFSQNDLRLHFGLEQAKKVDMVEIRWLSGQVDQIKDLAANQLHIIQEGGKVLSSAPLPQFKVRGKVKA